jgi:hypothetical protein
MRHLAEKGRFDKSDAGRPESPSRALPDATFSQSAVGGQA